MFRLSLLIEFQWGGLAGEVGVEEHHVYQYFLPDAKRPVHRTKTLVQKPLSVSYIVWSSSYTDSSSVAYYGASQL